MGNATLGWLVGLLLISGCEQKQSEDKDQNVTGSPMDNDAERTAEYWREVAGVRFAPDQSHRGEPMPQAPLVDNLGRKTALSGSGKRPILVNFWAHWCIPCRAEMPTLNTLAKRYNSQFLIVTVNEDQMDPSSASLGALPIDPTIMQLTDGDGELGRMIAVHGLPTTILYGSDGRERWRLAGALDWNKDQANRLLSSVK